MREGALASEANTSLDRLKFLNPNFNILEDELIPSRYLPFVYTKWYSAPYDVTGMPSIAITTILQLIAVEVGFTVSIEESLDGENWSALSPSAFNPPLDEQTLGAAGDVLSLKMYLRTHFIRVVISASGGSSTWTGTELIVEIMSGEA
jgi:hypothetical protein